MVYLDNGSGGFTVARNVLEAADAATLIHQLRAGDAGRRAVAAAQPRRLELGALAEGRRRPCKNQTVNTTEIGAGDPLPKEASEVWRGRRAAGLDF